MINLGAANALLFIVIDPPSINSHECILQWNVQGMSSSKEDILRLIEKYKPAVLSLQETYYGGDFTAKLPGYHGLAKQGHFSQRFFGGVALYIHQSCPFKPISIDSPFQLVAAQVHMPGYRRVTIASLYLPPRMNFNLTELRQTLDQLPSPVILLGDFNAHHPSWGNTTTNSRGRDIDSLLSLYPLVSLNTGTATHMSGSAIDISLVSPQIASDFQWFTSESVLSSDHFPILIFVHLANPLQETQHERWNYKKGKWDQYSRDPHWKSLEEASLPSDPAEALDVMYSALTTLGERWIPKYCQRRFYAKPWWNVDCRRAFNKREKLYRQYKQTGQQDHKLEWQQARREASNVFSQAKEASWKEYTNNLTVHSKSSDVWQMTRSIRGRPSPRISILSSGSTCSSKLEDIVETLADSFEAVSSEKNYDPEFINHKSRMEKLPIHCQSDNTEPYNGPFSLQELTNAISECRVTAPGKDRISNLMFKHMPENGREYLLKVFNLLWQENHFHPAWRSANVLPIPKPGKDHSDPVNYRPIALTSCVCKLFERMINNRLVEFLENKKQLSNIQCGFRKNRSAVDHLVRFDTFVRQAFAKGQKVGAVFFDLEKAYDTAWRHGILRDLSKAGIRGRLLSFVDQFLTDRHFHVQLSSAQSTERVQQTGIPQGSTLSVTLFAIKINSLAAEIPPELFSSLFVDDVLIACADDNLQSLQRRLQHGVDKIATWAKLNGFRFSAKKTEMMYFYSGTEPVYKPPVMLDQKALNQPPSIRFLGLHFDPKLTYREHIAKLRSKCLKDLNLLKSISAQSWGADQETMMRLYRSLIRSKLDYGCIVYGAASATYLSSLDTVANEAMRIASGAFRSSPIVSLNVLLNEPTLNRRRQDLTLRYFYKLKCHFLNPAYSSVHNDRLSQLFTSHNYNSPLIMRAKRALASYEMPQLYVIPYKTPSVFSWQLLHPQADKDFLFIPRKELSSSALKQYHGETADAFEDHVAIYTDGSKSPQGVGAAAVCGQRTFSLSLPPEASILTAELHAIKLALNFIADSVRTKFIIFTDSLSSVEVLSRGSLANHFTWRICEQIHLLLSSGKTVVVSWLPSHVGILGNERADQAAKLAARRPPEFALLPYRDLDRTIRRRTYDKWTLDWENENKDLQLIKPSPGPWEIPNGLTRRERVVMNRLRLSHTRITHRFLFDEDTLGQRPECQWCESALLTVKHLLISCPALAHSRHRFFTPTSNANLTMESILGEKADPSKVLAFLRHLEIFEEI